MKAAVLSAVVAVLRTGGNNYIAALLLVEPGRVASDGLEAPARHHLVCVCVWMLLYVRRLPVPHVRSRSCPWH